MNHNPGHLGVASCPRVRTDTGCPSARRRLLLTALGAYVLAASRISFAQQRKAYRIGILMDSPTSPGVEGLFQGLRELGYIEGKNLFIERRFTGDDAGRALPMAQELAALKVDLIFASSSTYVEAARQATSKIPIVFATHNDPVGSGHVISLARPGGNSTGVTQMATLLDAKRLELLKELLPGAIRVAVLANPTTPSHVPTLKEAEQAGRKLGLKLHPIEASTPQQFDLAFEAAARAGDQAMLLLTSPLSILEHKRVTALALTYRLPVVFAQTFFAEAGGLISYGPDRFELYRAAASYIDRILKGASPPTMAVSQPTRFELAINLKTAKAIGLTIPQSVLLRADKVIE
jgi:putative ABC transport system substrate-binding protein